MTAALDLPTRPEPAPTVDVSTARALESDKPRIHVGNCFDLLRLVLAAMVLVTHGHEVVGVPDPTRALFKHQLGIGNLAVLGFFGLSGYLISGSWIRTPRVLPFVAARSLRILPGLWGVLLFSAVVAGPLLYRFNRVDTPYPLSGPDSATSYFMKNALVRVGQWDIGAATAEAHRPGMNYSLWSLEPEVHCYAAVMLFGLCQALTVNRHLFLLLTAVLTGMHLLLLSPDNATPLFAPTFLYLSKNQPFYLAFFAGAALRLYREHWTANLPACWLLGLACAGLLKFGGFMAFGPILFSVLLVYCGHCFSCRLKHDFSYGIYLYHVPVYHCFAAAGVQTARPWAFVVLGAATTLLIAAASWFLIERPAMALKGVILRGKSSGA